MKPTSCETEHEFTLVLDGIQDYDERVEDALFEAGCDDATLGRRNGRVFLTFARTAPSLRKAVLSAVRDIRKASIGATVLRVDLCNLVTQAEIARHIGRTRQLVHQYITGARGPGGFPAPVCPASAEAPLWYWCEVAQWLSQNGFVPETVRQEAQDVAVINSVLELEHQRRLDEKTTIEVMRSLGMTCR